MPLQAGRPGAVIALAVAYSALAHYTNTSRGVEDLGTLVALAPVLLAALSLAWHAKHRSIALSLFGLGCALLAFAWPILTARYVWIYWAEHAGTQLFFCTVFARSLAAGREPLCTHFARAVHGPLSTELERYTRQVTHAWAIFFAAMASMSTLVFAAAPLAAWSVFSNFFTAPLIGLMFVVEYLVRLRKHPQMKHAHILDGIKAYWNSPAA